MRQYNGERVCLVRDERAFDPATGQQLVREYRGTEDDINLKAQALEADGWQTRISAESGVHSLVATAPDISTDGETIAGVDDEWSFSIDLQAVDFWASPVLAREVGKILNDADPELANPADIRRVLTTWKRAVNKQLDFSYNASGGVQKDADGNALRGPTPLEYFKGYDKDGAAYSTGDDFEFLKKVYQQVVAGLTSVEVSNVSIQRRRQVPALSTLRFQTDIAQKVWTPAKFILDFEVPDHIQPLLPKSKGPLPFPFSVWGYNLRSQAAQSVGGSVRIVESLGWTFAAWSTLTHEIIGTVPP